MFSLILQCSKIKYKIGLESSIRELKRYQAEMKRLGLENGTVIIAKKFRMRRSSLAGTI